MNAKRIPLAVPKIAAYQYQAYPLAVLNDREETLPWLYSNYIQLCFAKDFTRAPLPFLPYVYDHAISPWLVTQRLKRETLRWFDLDIVYFLRTALSNDSCIYLNVDEQYIPNRESYGQKEFLHDVLVRGFDDEREVFHLVGYDQESIYAETEVSYAEMELAYNGHDDMMDFMHHILLYKYNELGSYTFDPCLVADLLEDYLLGRGTAKRFYMLKSEPLDPGFGAEGVVWGVDCYEYLKKYLSMLLTREARFDQKIMHVLWEHKRLMLERLRWLEQQGHLDPALGLSEAYQTIERDVFLFRNKLIKTTIDLKIERVANAPEWIDELRVHEEKLLIAAVRALRSHA